MLGWSTCLFPDWLHIEICQEVWKREETMGENALAVYESAVILWFS